MKKNVALEKRFVRLCSKVNFSDAVFQEIEQLLTRHLNWQYIIKFAISQQVVSLIYSNLKQHQKQDLVPAEYVTIMSKKYIAAFGWNILIFDELKHVFNLLHNARIEAAVLKGPVLLETAYKDWGVRKTSDLDILVREQDLDSAKNALLDNGYNYYISEPTEQSRNPLFHHHAIPLCRTKCGPAVELHWNVRVNRMFQININDFWTRAIPGRINGCETMLLSSEDMILHLCVHHFYKFKQIITYREINDIVAVILKYQEVLDWEQILNTSLHYKIASFVYAGLFFADQEIPGIIPAAILAKLKSEYSNEYFTRLYKIHKIEQQFFSISRRLSLSPKFSEKVNHILVYLFPSQQKLCDKYRLPANSNRVYLYRVLHPVIALFNRIIPVLHFGFLFCQKLFFTILNNAGVSRPTSPTTIFNIE